LLSISAVIMLSTEVGRRISMPQDAPDYAKMIHDEQAKQKDTPSDDETTVLLESDVCVITDGDVSRGYFPKEMIKMLVGGGDWDQLEPPRSTLEIPDYNGQMLRSERHFRRVAIGAVICYLFLVWLAFAVAGDSGIEINKIEQGSATFACACLLVTLLLQMLPIFIHKGEHPTSGVVFAAVCVQCIAMTTNALIAFGTPPIIIDPVTGARVSLLRWAEWAPLAFTMTFLVEGSDVPDQRYEKYKCLNALIPLSHLPQFSFSICYIAGG